jgi:hypothetical protein
MAERELKETLSEVSSRDKEELLEEIELLKRKEGRPKRGITRGSEEGRLAETHRVAGENGRIWSSITSARCKMSAKSGATSKAEGNSRATQRTPGGA